MKLASIKPNELAVNQRRFLHSDRRKFRPRGRAAEALYHARSDCQLRTTQSAFGEGGGKLRRGEIGRAGTEANSFNAVFGAWSC
jgi:hypothetical protein